LIFSAVKVSSGVFPTARSSDFADQLKVGRFYQWSHDFIAFGPSSTGRQMPARGNRRPDSTQCLHLAVAAPLVSAGAAVALLK